MNTRRNFLKQATIGAVASTTLVAEAQSTPENTALHHHYAAAALTGLCSTLKDADIEQIAVGNDGGYVVEAANRLARAMVASRGRV